MKTKKDRIDYLKKLNDEYLKRKEELKRKMDSGEEPYHPNVIFFDEDTIYQINLPKPIPRQLYNELFIKGIIPKNDLIVGNYYLGKCRNAKVAKWNGKVFTYMRSHFGNYFPEDINHLEDDDGFDLFIPLKEIKPNDNQIIKK